jgi:hypothetical protein
VGHCPLTNGGHKDAPKDLKVCTLPINNPHLEYTCLLKDGSYAIFTHADICDYIDPGHNADRGFFLKDILVRQGPLHPGDKHYMGLEYNLLIQWLNKEATWEPIYKESRLVERESIRHLHLHHGH